MKILAILDVVAGADMRRVRDSLEEELRGSWDLYRTGILREAYSTAAPTRVVFILEVDDAQEAQRHFARMPLITAGLMQLELVELRPFTNWSMLFADAT